MFFFALQIKFAVLEINLIDSKSKITRQKEVPRISEAPCYIAFQSRSFLFHLSFNIPIILHNFPFKEFFSVFFCELISILFC